MAQKPKSSAKRPRRSQGKAPDAPFPSAVVVDLVANRLVYDPIPDAQAQEPSLHYSVMLEDFNITEERISGFCNLAITKKVEDHTIVEFTASYVFAFTMEPGGAPMESIESLVKKVAESIVWPRFRDLFALINIQADLRMPALPYFLENIQLSAALAASGS